MFQDLACSTAKIISLFNLFSRIDEEIKTGDGLRKETVKTESQVIKARQILGALLGHEFFKTLHRGSDGIYTR